MGILITPHKVHLSTCTSTIVRLYRISSDSVVSGNNMSHNKIDFMYSNKTLFKIFLSQSIIQEGGEKE